MHVLLKRLTCAAVIAALPALSSGAQVPLTVELVASGFDEPLYVTSPVGDVNRQFVVEIGGKIKVVKNGVVLPTPFLDLGASGLNKIKKGFDFGLLGIAFHPNYATNGKFYVDYTDAAAGSTVIEQYMVSGNPDVADPASGVVILGPIVQPQDNHNGGCIQFSPLDGMLYVGMGDGGGAFDEEAGHAPEGNGQSKATLLGKMLRLDVDLPPPYIPADNPFVGDPLVLDEIWFIGLRMPWRFSFDRQTGDMFIGDVGQDLVEEVDFASAGVSGLNFGWRCMEGSLCTGKTGCLCASAALTMPIWEYTQLATGGQSVIGGYVYRGCAIPDLQGTYFCGDWLQILWTFDYDGTVLTNLINRTAELAPAVGAIDEVASFGEDALGEIYIVDRGPNGSPGTGELYRVVSATPLAGVDCDADGQFDKCEIGMDPALDLNLNGVLDACEGLSLNGDVASISISGGGVQTLSLDAGVANAGAQFIVAGTFTGTSPGMTFGALSVPLNFDLYTNRTLTQPSPPLSGSMGKLDATGTATAIFRVPAGILSPASVGLEVDHAYVLFAPGPYFVSNSIAVVLDA